MEKLTFGIQIIVGIILIIIANVLSLVLHNGIFSNISWVIYGLLFIINPVYPERYGNNEKKAKLGVRIAGIICIAVFVLLMAIVYLGAKSGKLQHFFKVHPWIPKILVLGYIVFAGCFMFPIRSEPFPLDFQGVYLLAASHGVIALAFAGIWGPDRERMVYIATFVLTSIGMVCRYLLEFGEVSNTYNFTLFNIVSYLVIIPIGTTFAYRLMAGGLNRR